VSIKARIAGMAAKFGLGKFVIPGLIAASLAGGAWAWWATSQMKSCNQDLGTTAEKLETERRTAKRNKAIVLELSRRLSDEVNKNALDMEAMARENAALERRRESERREAAREREERDEIYDTDETCESWRASLVCPAIADRMRDRARALDKPGSDRDSGADDPEDP